MGVIGIEECLNENAATVATAAANNAASVATTMHIGERAGRGQRSVILQGGTTASKEGHLRLPDEFYQGLHFGVSAWNIWGEKVGWLGFIPFFEGYDVYGYLTAGRVLDWELTNSLCPLKIRNFQGSSLSVTNFRVVTISMVHNLHDIEKYFPSGNWPP